MSPVPSRPLVVVPALDEQDAVGSVVSNVRQSLPDTTVLVVDDGSRDLTGRVARRHGAVVATHAANLGVGGAMRTGFLYALRHGHDAVIQVDGDGQHETAEITRLLEALDNHDVVVGSRFLQPSGYRIGTLRRLAIRMLSRAVSIHSRTRITDATSGFRAMGPRALRLFSVYYPVEYLGDTVESLIIAAKVGLDITEIPVQMHRRRSGRASQSFPMAVMHLIRAVFVALQSFIRGVPRGAADIIRSDP